MGRIHVLSEQVANKIAAGEVVERPASVVKELLENALDAGATRIKINVEAGGKKLIQITDNGCGMVRDDAMLAFERHATSKIKDAEDLLSVATLGFRGEALPSIASVSRLRLETCAAVENPPLPKEGKDGAPTAVEGTEKSPLKPKEGLNGPPTPASGTIIEINGGKMARVEEAGLPQGTSITVRDLFFNTPARKKFLKAESTELSHIASLVTHYALAHPEKHFELHSATNAMLVAPPVAGYSERVYQVFGKETLDQLIAVAAVQALEHVGLPQPPPWRRQEVEEDEEGGRGARPTQPGQMRLHGFVSKPEIQKLNRNSIYVFVNGRLIRDRLVQHGLTEAYRNIIPPSVYPVVLLFLELPAGEVDVNVHPSKTEVRFRQSTVLHDFVRDTVRAALMKARPAPQFTTEIHAHATASSGLTPGAREWEPPSDIVGNGAVVAPGFYEPSGAYGFALQAPVAPPVSARFQFYGGIVVEANAAIPVARAQERRDEDVIPDVIPDNGCAPAIEVREEEPTLAALGTLRPLGQIRNSFILAVNEDGLWIVDQHVAHERVLFERVLKQRATQKVESQRLLMPIVLELSPAQQAVFGEIADELQHNGFEAEPFGARSVAVKVAPAGVDAAAVEKMLHELLDQISREEQSLNLEKIRGRIAASIACHAAIKVNMPLEQNKMEWLLAELAKTDHPMSCPHGRPVVLRYSVKDIQKAFKRI
jgi:DNA mismatch repair protein MutL